MARLTDSREPCVAPLNGRKTSLAPTARRSSFRLTHNAGRHGWCLPAGNLGGHQGAFRVCPKVSNPLSGDWQRHVLASTEVLGARVVLYIAAKKWDMATVVANHLVKVDPQTSGWWISLAYAVRRIEGVEKAEAILLGWTLRHRPPSDVFGRCVDDSCHAAGLVTLGLRMRHRGAASRRGAVSLEELARLGRVLPEGSIPIDAPRLVSFVLRVLCLPRTAYWTLSW
jgi:hypothetical protein